VNSHKLEQINQAYKKAISQVLLKLFPEPGEIVIGEVLIDPSMQHGKVWLSCSKEMLARVEKRRSEIQMMTQRYVKTRYIPKLYFFIDDKYTEHMEDLFEKIEEEHED
jgi:ribosome-binding factor A